MHYEDEFPLATNLLHLNHAGIGPWPRRTVAAIRGFAEENATFGSLHWPTWEKSILRLRELLRDLIGADSSNASSSNEVALVKNTSEGVSIVAYGLDWRPGDNVVVGRQEFPSNRFAWESLAERFGVEVRLADLIGDAPEESLLAHLDAGTRLLAVSSIQYTTGRRVDLARLGQACRQNGSLFCVDAIQSLGASPFDVEAACADFVCADGHKWLLAPEGAGIFYCRRERLETLKLNQFGWHITNNPNDYEATEWRLAENATRFECGSLNHIGFIGLLASLELLNEVGLEQVFKEVESKISYLIEQLDKNRFQILTPEAIEQRGGILTLRRLDADNDALFSHLLKHGVLCAKRAGGVRLSPHFYTPQSVLDRALTLLHEDV